jgi:hypothetical protein
MYFMDYQFSRFVFSNILILLVLSPFIELIIHTSYSKTPPVSASNGSFYADFKGDEIGGLVIGIPWEDIGSVEKAGGVHVLYGSSSRVQVVSPDDKFWHQNKVRIKDKCEVENFFGSVLPS